MRPSDPTLFSSHYEKQTLLFHLQHAMDANYDRLGKLSGVAARSNSQQQISNTGSGHDGSHGGGPPRSYRIAELKGFLPLSNDGSLTGRALPSLIQSRSSTNINELKNSLARTNTYSGTSLSGKRPFGRRRSSASEERPLSSAESRDGPNHQDLEAGRRMSHYPTWASEHGDDERKDDRRMSVLHTPQMRSQRLIGNSNPRYRWGQYWKTEEELNDLPKPLRKYYERNNHLIQHYMYIDKLLDSSLPHNLIQEYNQPSNSSQGYGATAPDVPATISEEPSPGASPALNGTPHASFDGNASSDSLPNGSLKPPRVKRTPKDLYRIQEDDTTPLLGKRTSEEGEEEEIKAPDLEIEDEADSQSSVVTWAIYINMAANVVLLAMKIVVVALSSSVSVLASLVDAALDLLSTAIIWITTYLISRNDQYSYPVGRRRLEPVGVLVFSVIMMTSFVQVALEGLQKLTGPDHTVVQLTIPAIVIMVATVVVKGLCWFYCRLINNSSVQALAQDAMTDVVFNTFSIIFPLIGFYARVWWLDPLGGIILSLYVIYNWGGTSSQHIKNLTGAAANADERNILLYLTMRFAKTIKQIQGVTAYHSGDKLNCEVDIVLDEDTSLRDSHDLGESLQYVLESVPYVDRAFVHMDYAGWNLPSHMRQD